MYTNGYVDTWRNNTIWIYIHFTNKVWCFDQSGSLIKAWFEHISTLHKCFHPLQWRDYPPLTVTDQSASFVYVTWLDTSQSGPSSEVTWLLPTWGNTDSFCHHPTGLYHHMLCHLLAALSVLVCDWLSHGIGWFHWLMKVIPSTSSQFV